jgi:hypothetical protein
VGEDEVKDNALRLGPAYPLIGILRRLGCTDVFLSNCYDDEAIFYVMWRSIEPCRYMISWRGVKDKMVFTAIRAFVGTNNGRIVNFYEIAYPGEREVTGTSVEFTCPGEGYVQDPTPRTVTIKECDILINEKRCRERLCA